MRQRSNVILEYGIYMLAYLVSYVFSLAGFELFAGGVLIIAAVYLYLRWYKETRNLVDLRGLFTLAWVGGQGIACLQLSYLQREWHYLTWLCFFLIYMGFGIGYEWGLKDGRVERRVVRSKMYSKRILRCMNILGVVSLACFVLEVVIRGYVPLFSELPHAYSYFSVTGVHYFTVSCILLPALSVLYFQCEEKVSAREKAILLFWNIISVLIPILCVSRFQILFAVGFALVVYVITNKSIKGRTVFLILLVLVPLYILLTVARNHDASYLNSIFEMKNSDIPIFITQPYMYVVNNFENFNLMVVNLSKHSYGVRMLFPVIALSGAKFVFPQLVNFPLFLTKPELNTLTMFYDAYYDFGVFGVLALAVTIGAVARMVIINARKVENPIIFMFYGQIAIYLGLAFFTTWFSNPTTWFWFVLTGIMFWYVGKGKTKEDNNE
ncbi:oligosaccharide repeat unit polymerase [Lachnospiraceae bacterium PF1-21]|uniref:O-antigen polymerase n=1 Tax=Ohessyouella blattaphilus TaxID=2949333 RepID=UPI003E21CF1E